MVHSLDSVTLYCTLSHNSTLFGHAGPCIETAIDGGVIYFTQFHKIDHYQVQCPSMLTTSIYWKTVNTSMENVNPMISIAHVYVRDRDYSVSVTMNMSNRRLHVFKYSEDKSQCAYEIFDNYSEACRYLEQVLG